LLFHHRLVYVDYVPNPTLVVGKDQKSTIRESVQSLNMCLVFRNQKCTDCVKRSKQLVTKSQAHGVFTESTSNSWYISTCKCTSVKFARMQSVVI